MANRAFFHGPNLVNDRYLHNQIWITTAPGQPPIAPPCVTPLQPRNTAPASVPTPMNSPNIGTGPAPPTAPNMGSTNVAPEPTPTVDYNNWIIPGTMPAGNHASPNTRIIDDGWKAPTFPPGTILPMPYPTLMEFITWDRIKFLWVEQDKLVKEIAAKEKKLEENSIDKRKSQWQVLHFNAELKDLARNHVTALQKLRSLHIRANTKKRTYNRQFRLIVESYNEIQADGKSYIRMHKNNVREMTLQNDVIIPGLLKDLKGKKSAVEAEIAALEDDWCGYSNEAPYTIHRV